MRFRNLTHLDDKRLHALFVRFTRPYRHDDLDVRVRYSRGADFSGTCFYREKRIHINLGRQNRYPYPMNTHIARARSDKRRWWRELYSITLADAYQLALFVYLHELYHHLVKLAGRNTRQKEGMCDRFATRVLVDHFGCPLRDRAGRAVDRTVWDFKDLDRFVSVAPWGAKAKAAVRPRLPVAPAAPREIPVIVLDAPREQAAREAPTTPTQLEFGFPAGR